MRLRYVLLALLLVAGVPRLGLAPAWAQSAAVQKLLDDGDDAFSRGDYSQAAALYDRAIAAEPNSIDPAYFAKRADVFTLRRNFAGGLQWIDDVAARYRPGDRLILEKKAILLGAAGRDREALALAEQVVAAVPRAYALHLLIGDRTFLAPRRAGRAITAYQAFLATRPPALASGDQAIAVKLAFAYLTRAAAGGATSAADFAAANRRLTQLGAGTLTPGEARAVRNARCGTLTGLGRHLDAAAWCAAAIAASGAAVDPALLYNEGVAQLGLGHTAGAAASAERYLRLRPQANRGWLLRGDVLAAIGDLDGADAAYQHAPEGAEAPEVALRRGRLALRRRPPALELAIAQLDRARRAYPDDVELTIALAGAESDAGRFADAAALADAAAARLASAPGRARLLVIAARALERGGGTLDAALAHYRDALAADGDSRDARAGAVALLNRQATEPGVDGAAAEAALVAALALDADAAMTRYNRGALRLAAGDPAAALIELERAAAIAPSEPRVRWLQGRAQLAIGATAPAIATLEPALALAERAGDRVVAAAVGVDLGGALVEAGRLDDALAVLDRVALAGTTSDALERNRALAHLRRGHARLGAGRIAEASADLERAAAASARLTADERLVLAFGQGAAALAAGRVRDGRARLERLTRELDGRPVPGLVAPWDRAGVDLFLAYADYLDDSPAARRQAIKALDRLSRAGGAVQPRARTLLRSCHQLLAATLLDAGDAAGARRELEAARAVNAGRDVRLEHNLIVLAAWSAPETARAALEQLGGQPPEALVNLGVIAHRDGRTLEAYALWKRALDAGVARPAVVMWMQSIERVFGIAPGS